MTITWLGHSCFLLESGGFRVLLDPFRDVPGLADVEAEADAVYCSHGHFDHAYTDRVRLTSGRENPFTVTEIPTFHDGQGGALRGENTIRVFSAEGIAVAHLGDLGHQLSPEQIAVVGPVDLVMVPVGGTYTVDAAGAKRVCEALSPKWAVPMHYRHTPYGLPNVGGVEDFLSLWGPEQVHRLELDPPLLEPAFRFFSFEAFGGPKDLNIHGKLSFVKG